MKKKTSLDIKEILKKLDIEDRGIYENYFYVINIANSDDYARMYTTLSNNAINTEYPSFAVNTNNSVTKITNYFEIDEGGMTYNIFLIANMLEDRYYLKIGEK